MAPVMLPSVKHEKLRIASGVVMENGRYAFLNHAKLKCSYQRLQTFGFLMSEVNVESKSVRRLPEILSMYLYMLLFRGYCLRYVVIVFSWCHVQEI